MTIVNRTVPLALATLGYSDEQIEQIEAPHQRARDDRRGAGSGRRAPAGVRRGRGRAGDLAHGPHRDDGRGPAVHLGRDLQDGEPAADGDGRGHRRRLHAGVAARRQGAGHLPRRVEDGAGAAHRRAGGQPAPIDVEAAIAAAVAEAMAKAPPRRGGCRSERQSITHKFSIGGHEGYITAGMYEDGTLGEIFLTDIGKEGSTLRGMMNSFATAISIALQYGVPLETLVAEVQLHALRAGGDHPEPGDPVRQVDARLHHALAGVAVPRRRHAGGVRHPHASRSGPARRPRRRCSRTRGDTAGPSDQPATPTNGGQATAGATGTERLRRHRAAGPPDRRRRPDRAGDRGADRQPPVVPARLQGLDLGPACGQCGGMMQRTGSCYTCGSCGNNTGCG